MGSVSGQIVFLLPVSSQPRYHKRIQAFADCGYTARLFSFDRPYFKGKPGVSYVSLGSLEHGRYLSRLWKLARAIRVLTAHRDVLRQASCLYAFGTDMALLAMAATFLLGLSVPVVYELGDIRSLMVREGIVGKLARWMERLLLRGVKRVVVTSLAFRDEYLIRIQGIARENVFVLENKLYPPVPPRLKKQRWDKSRPLVIGLFGVLRCNRSWERLYELAKQEPGNIEVYIRGYQMSLHQFVERVEELENLRYEGEYVSPDDLADMYGRIDVCWIGNMGENTVNGRWAMPNRWYESLYYQVPVVVHVHSAMAPLIREKGCGWVVDFDSREDVFRFWSELTPETYEAAYERCCQIPETDVIGLDDHRELISNHLGM